MNKDHLTKEDYLMYLLSSEGWEWIKSEHPGYVCLAKDDFKWNLTLGFTIHDLIEASRRQSYLLGLKDGKGN